MKISMKEEFNNDWITREAGEKLRYLLLDHIREKKPIVLDFEGLVIASTSFFDEGIAKLSDDGVTPQNFNSVVSIVNLHSRDNQLLVSLCKRRGFPIKNFEDEHAG